MISKEMWASIDETISPVERKVFLGTYAVSSLHSIGVRIAGDVFNPNSMIGNLAYNGGDFYDGYLMSIMTEVLSKVFFRRMPASLRRGISSLGGMLSVVLNETELFPLHRGTAEIADIPAGLLGAACYLGVSLWANRGNQYTQNTQTEKLPTPIPGME